MPMAEAIDEDPKEDDANQLMRYRWESLKKQHRSFCRLSASLIRLLLVYIQVSVLLTNNIALSVEDRFLIGSSIRTKCRRKFLRTYTKIFDIPLHLKLLQWECPDECKYMCMWPVVGWFVDAGIGVQQFYGKWPFVRILGIQEPASMLFSLLNLASHLFMIKRFRREVSPKAPFYWITHIFCFVCCHAWFWSTLFHLRDIRFTEIMDYLGALSMVSFSVYHFAIRVTAVDSYNQWYSMFFGISIGLHFVYHSYTTFFVQMDYGYNMLINVALGAVNIIGWTVWCFKQYKKKPYVKQCAIFTGLVGLTTLLEIMDFPPLLWVLDAHALWHLTTSPLVIFWYRFLIDDCHHLTELLDLEKIA
uniref:Post-GPI attachment to proteins factor 3 n=1 Tax=Scapholeberis mucronata TaxID=202097 RepID=A0A4Y7NN51_9CRUS|nr:EOG090X0702 [Scapholeberis mucronata]